MLVRSNGCCANNFMTNDPNSRTDGGRLFHLSAVLCAAFAIWGVAAPDSLAGAATAVTTSVFRSLDWFFMMSVTLFLGLALWLMFSKYGRLKLGAPDDEPEFSTASWIAMLFSAGMGVGILFWGAAEPLTHFASPPVGDGATAYAARRALVITNFHWGLHAWAVYSMGALVLAYFAYRRGRVYLAGEPIRDAFEGRWVRPFAFSADLIAVFGVAFGVAGSLVMGAMQLETGLKVTTGISMNSTALRLILLLVLTVAYLLSASTSLDKGIKILSNTNIALAILLLFFVLAAGPTGFLLRGFVTALGDYIAALPGLTLQLYPYSDAGGWVQSWTLTYFVWWIAWAPFVGIFVARISRGRTIREFVAGVTLAPTIASILWFAVFGGIGLHAETAGDAGLAALVAENVSLALFALFDTLPGSVMLSTVSVVLIFVFLVTSADSATFVLGQLTSGGSFNPPTVRKLTWGIGLSLLSAGLLLADSMAAIRAMAVLGAIPFTFVMIVQIAALLRTLPADLRQTEADELEAAIEAELEEQAEEAAAAGEVA